LADFAGLALSPAESRRMTGMGERRRNAYLCARLAIKRLWRKLASAGNRKAAAIETVTANGPQPVIPLVAGQPYFCSVSHDDRFAVAVAGKRPLGVDVAKISPRPHRCRRIFMKPSEQALIAPKSISDQEAALRIWSVKEAAAKALDLSLADAWEQIKVLTLEEKISRFKHVDGAAASALHATFQGHLFTLIQGLNDNGLQQG
jgi:phosphopantetheinyl transferase